MSWPAYSLTPEVTQHAGSMRHKTKVAMICCVHVSALSPFQNKGHIISQQQFLNRSPKIYYFMFIIMCFFVTWIDATVWTKAVWLLRLCEQHLKKGRGRSFCPFKDHKCSWYIRSLENHLGIFSGWTRQSALRNQWSILIGILVIADTATGYIDSDLMTTALWHNAYKTMTTVWNSAQTVYNKIV